MAPQFLFIDYFQRIAAFYTEEYIQWAIMMVGKGNTVCESPR
jgi:hypothetical protein